MTRFEKRLAIDAGLLGILLTILTVVLDRAGGLRVVEWYLDDFRTRHFQYYTPKPTDQLVHLDIDDEAINSIGPWPWPRSKWARFIDELNVAGAKSVCLDVMFPEEQPAEMVPGQAPIDGDQQFADALAHFRTSGAGRGVLMPLAVGVDNPLIQTPLSAAMVEEFRKDPEIDDATLIAHLESQHLDSPTLISDVAKGISSALEQALFIKVRHEVEAGNSTDLEKLREVLLPRSYATGVRSTGYAVLKRVIPRVISFEALVPLTRSVPGRLPPVLSRGVEETFPIPKLAASSAYSGFVDLWQVDDGKVRLMPLWTLDRDRLIPQIGFSLACASLGVNTKDVELAADHVTIPLPDGRLIRIPVYTRESDRGTVGMLMDIPWLGSTDWKTIYDFPRHQKEYVQHYSLVHLEDILDIDAKIIDNNQGALEAIKAVGSKEDAERLQQSHPDFSDGVSWNKLMSDTLDNLPPGELDELRPILDDENKIQAAALTAAKDNPDPNGKANFIEHARAVRKMLQCPKINDDLARQRIEFRQKTARLLYGKTVLIGWLGSGGIDYRPTPLHRACPGVIVHGIIFNAIMSGFFLTRAAAWTTVVLTLLAGLLTTASSSLLGTYRALAAAAGIIFVFAIFNFLFLFDRHKTEVDAAGPIMATILVYGGCTLTRYIREQSEKARITRRFRSYVDPSLVNYLLEHPEKATLAGEERELSVVFTDLQGFTSVSELLKRDTVALLNEYLGLMEPAIRKHRGLINKFLGDGIMFFFGAPEPFPDDVNLHALAAVKTVIEMQRVMIPFNKSLLERGLPTLKMRAGVSTGDMVVGDAGTPARSDYTVLGDRVNFAARLESANKYTGTLILLSDRTVELLNDRYLVRPIGRLQVVGKKEPVMTFEPIALIEEATDEQRKLVELTRAMTESYIAGKFHDCLAATHELIETFGEATQGKLCGLYRRLSTEYLRNPPVEFLGQIKLEEK